MIDERWPGRREFLGAGLGAFAVAALPGAFRPGRTLVRRSVPVMGTVAEFGVVGRDPARAHRAVDAAVAELRRVESLMSRFRDDSDVGRANLRAAGRAVPVSNETADVLEEGLRWARATGGSFDPALGRVVRLWDVTHRSAPPARGRVGELAGRGLWRFLEVDRAGSVPRVRYHDADVAVDLGGIAKGYAVDRAAEALRARGFFDALVNVGGDLRVMGLSEDRDVWAVGVRSPEDPDRIATTLRVTDAAVATSGDYTRSFSHGGRRYHHLLDPARAEPRRTDVRTLTVVAGSCVQADAAATAAFGCEPGRADRVLALAVGGARIAHTG